MSTMGLSVIIPTHSRHPSLAPCLDSVRAQSYTNIEIIVVDDASTDDTGAYLQSIRDQRLWVITNPHNLGVAQTRNVGAARANHDVVVFIDDDCVAEPGWLRAYARTFQKQSVDWAFGQTSYISPAYRGHFPERLVTNGRGQWPGGGNVAYRREVFLGVGGFDPAYVRLNNEDTELAVRLVAQGYHYARVSDALVHHQAARWTVRTLWRSYPNIAIWPALKRRYPLHYREFRPDVLFGVIAAPRDYLYLLLLPLLIPVQLMRYWVHGERSLRLFFTRWPAWLIARRLAIWRQAWRQRVMVL